MARKPRNYRAEYDKYHGTPEQKKNRAKRNAARREYEKAHGDLPRNVDVDHKRSLDKGGSNAKSNLRALSRAKNRGYARDKNNQPKR
jgi:hypothetical protein